MTVFNIYQPSGRIEINGTLTVLHVRQTQEKTLVYTGEDKTTGREYKEHTMPHNRYSMGSNKLLNPNVAGISQFEQDILELLKTLD